MNKAEKLLAARKKLKEFQQKKQTHHSDVTPDVQNQIKDDIVTSDNNTINSSINHNVEQSFDIPTIKSINFPTTDDNTSEKSINETTTTNEIDKLINADDVNQTNDKFISENLPNNYWTNNDSTKNNDIFDHFKFPEMKKDDQEDEFSKLTNGNIDVNDMSIVTNENDNSQSLQKQHLLDMATEVANALSENNVDTESSILPTDLQYKNEFLTTCLDKQKRLANKLHIQVSEYSSKIAELEAQLSTKDVEYESNILRIVNPLKEQLQIHAQTTGILVSEKAELTSSLTQFETIVKKKTEEINELCDKLKILQLKLTDYESNEMKLISSFNEIENIYKKLQIDYNHLDKKYNELKKDKDEQQMETAELRQNLNIKNTELTNLHRDYQEKINLLSLAELKIQQLTNTPQEMELIEGKHQTDNVLEQQLLQLNETLKKINTEKEESNKHYENYVKQLDARYETIVQELELTKTKLTEYEKNEESYIQRLSLMEQQYQQEKQKVDKLKHLEKHEETVDNLNKNINDLLIEKNSLNEIIESKNNEIELIKIELKKLQDYNEQYVDNKKLVTALESEQLGASRAVLQNQQLKLQLNEMHDAFVTLSNSKLDLTEKLQGERVIGKKLNAQLNKIENERDQLAEELKNKNTLLIDYEKNKLQSEQINDQMQHYQAQSTHARTLQDELQNALTTIQCLKNENQMLNNKLNDLTNNEKIHNNINDDNDNNTIEIGIDVGELKKLTTETEVQTINDDIDFIDSLDSEPVKKLEIRFKEAMEKVAELTDDKQKLEHLVLQLQGETETIGEYITLYQRQRAILNQKAQERNMAFNQVIEQRNQQQIQLHQLKVLVADLLKNQTNQEAVPIMPKTNDDIKSAESSENHTSEIEENNQPGIKKDEANEPLLKNDTTAKILDLLTEIKDCKDNCSIEPNFHPCLWCSGELITV
ncbi:hypothetical protein HCN44_005537 [Aphidius gifuensis]|uniref:Golgin subfamily A conserved domain-containing protein n=1 Tax=Aphidius gifuensis TaxID=684658 RepID=A0A834Y0V5_APHGI|nr:golgin subfamily A member 2-like [Aphidius gifuensis]KAF7997260.1 hypothetical protein HCN44_005537 [Aphidius gifuensis]